MNPARAAALLNGKAQSFSMGLGGERITDQDIAHALGKIWHPGARAMGRLKWAGQQQSHRDVYDHLMRDVVALRILDDWRDVKDGDLDKLVKIAIYVAVRPKLCPDCNGIGSVMIAKNRRPGRPRKDQKAVSSLKIVCQGCKGDGSTAHSERFLAVQSGFGRKRWEQIWSDRYYHQVKPILDKYEMLFWRGLRRALRD